MKKKFLILFLSTVSMFLLMLGYEIVKELLFDGYLTRWQSHFITIAFSSFVSLIITCLAMNQVQLIEKRQKEIQLKEEKIKSIKQVMSVVEHHVNNLANCMQIVQVEVEDSGTVSKETLNELHHLIVTTATEMQRLNHIENPYSENDFKIIF